MSDKGSLLGRKTGTRVLPLICLKMLLAGKILLAWFSPDLSGIGGNFCTKSLHCKTLLLTMFRVGIEYVSIAREGRLLFRLKLRRMTEISGFPTPDRRGVG